MIKETMETDVLVAGGGIAGIRAAIEASDQGANVILATKGAFGKDGAAVWIAGWGYEVALYPPDSTEQHVKDTIVGGKFLNNQELVQKFISLFPSTVQELERWGMRLAKKEGKFVQVRMPGHSYPRSLQHVKIGELLGGEYRKALPRQVRQRERIKILEDVVCVDLVKGDNGVGGAIVLDLRDGGLKLVRAKAIVLATGGYMGCFEVTTANPTLTGDGHGMAYRAGAEIEDMEFIQFMPTAPLWPASGRLDMLPYSLLNILHAYFYNSTGERFMERYYPQEKDFATREAQGRAIFREVRQGRGSPHGGAYLSFKHLPRNLVDAALEPLKENLFLKDLKEAGHDIREDGIEVGPTAHYVQGGCWVDDTCETNLEGLYAIGEVGSGGKDGADRLAGNSIPFCMVMGKVAGSQAADRARKKGLLDLDRGYQEKLVAEVISPLQREEGVTAWEIREKIRKLMSTYMVFERKGEDLLAGLKEIKAIREGLLPKLWVKSKSERFNMEWMAAIEARNMVDVAEMCMRAALMREESRGLHEREDFPKEDPNWLKHILIKRGPEGEMELTIRPVDFPYMKPEGGARGSV